MARTVTRIGFGGLALLLVCGCGSAPKVTVGRRAEPEPWDAQRVRELALEMEAVVQRAAAQPEDEIVQQVSTELEFGEDEVDPAALMGAADDLSYEIPSLVGLHMDTPEVAGALRARQLRAGTVREWKNRGCLAENPEGKVQHVDCEATGEDPTAGDRLAFLVIKENRSRRTVYVALQKNNRWPGRRMTDIQSAFAEAMHEMAEPTDLVAADGGGWRQKEPGATARAMAAEQESLAPAPRRSTSYQENWEQAEVWDVDVHSVPPRAIPQR